MKTVLSIILFLCLTFPAQAITTEESIYLENVDTVLQEMNELVEGIDLSTLTTEQSETIQNELQTLSDRVLTKDLPEDNTATWDLLSYATSKSCESLIVCFEAYEDGDLLTGSYASEDSIEYATLCITLLDLLKEREGE